MSKKKIAKKPNVKKSAAKKSAAKKPVTKKPVTKKPVTKKPIAEKPVTEKPVAEKPVAEKPVAPTWKERLISIPKTFMAYMKDSVAAIDEAKKERRLLAPLVFTAILFCGCVFLIGAHFLGVDYSIDNSDYLLNDLALLKNISVFSVRAALILGFVLFAALFTIFVFTRFVCVKLFSRGSKAKTVLSESVIEFGMNAIPLTFFFLIGGVLSNFVWWSFYPLIAFFALFFIILLIRSIFDTVDRKKQKLLMIFVMTVCIFNALLWINAFVIIVTGYSLLTVTQGVIKNIPNILDNINAWFDSVFGSFFNS